MKTETAQNIPPKGWETLASHEDRSVNHVLKTEDGGNWEARFVQRTDDYFIAYLSSHTGCRHACRFCHLTATAQSMMMPATQEIYLAQLDKTLETFDDRRSSGLPNPKRVHVNFMARGEALSNPIFQNNPDALYAALRERIQQSTDAEVKFLVSTIMPKDFDGRLEVAFSDPQSIPYYSLYSLDPEFRKRWLPKAMDPNRALDRLAEFQQSTNRPIVLHWAMIAGENDRPEDIEAVAQAVQSRDLKVRFNLVRYNPFSEKYGQESEEGVMVDRFEALQSIMTLPGSKIVARVGFDVKASCGMFVGQRRTG